MQATFIKSAGSAGGFPADQGAEAAFVGRSNSGKSSSINRITGQGKLARVSKTPGRTQLINFFDLDRDRRIVDLPGYGFARVPERIRSEWRGLIESYFRDRRSLKGLFLTVDIRRGLVEQDQTMIGFALALGCPVTILLTKSDKLSRGAGLRVRLETEKAVGNDIEVIRFSAVEPTGVEEARRCLLQWLG